MMKNLLKITALAFAILPFAAATVYAQNTATVTLNVVIQNASSITIGASYQDVTLTYDDPTDYTNGVSQSQTKAMTVISNQPYTVTVLASSDLTDASSNTIPVNDVEVTPTANPASGDVSVQAQAIPNASPGATIITSTAGTLGQDFDLDYSTANADQSDFNKPAGTYTTTLTYTLTLN